MKNIKFHQVIFAFWILLASSLEIRYRGERLDGLYGIIFDILNSLRMVGVLGIILFIALIFFVVKAEELLLIEKTSILDGKVFRSQTIWKLVLAIFYALFLVLGEAFRDQGNLSPLIGDIIQIVKASIGFFGYTILLFYGLTYVFYIWNKKPKMSYLKQYKLIEKWYGMLINKPFTTCFFFLFLVNIPNLIISYPGYMTGDALEQVKQVLDPVDYEYYMPFISDTVKLNNHAPILHTLYISGLIKAGKTLFNSYSIGFFISNLCQMCLLICAMSYALSYMIQSHVSEKVVTLVLALYAFHPGIRRYMMRAQKEQIYMAIFLVFMCFFHKLLTAKEYSKKEMIVCIVTGIGLTLLRNDAVYTLIITMLIAMLFFMKNRKKQAMFCMIAVCLFLSTLLWNHVILPSAKITPGGAQEMFSLPLQQTARYVCNIGESVTLEEREAIDKIIVYDEIEARYDPECSDLIKITYHQDASTADKLNYLRVWLKMGLKHPRIYVEATLHNKYEYFDLNAYIKNLASYKESEEQMLRFATDMPSSPMNIAYPEILRKIRNYYELLENLVFNLPIMRYVLSSSIYIALAVFFWCYNIANRKKNPIIFGLPLIVNILVLIAGPMNGSYLRYGYPYVILMPIFVLLGMKMNHDVVDCVEPDTSYGR